MWSIPTDKIDPVKRRPGLKCHTVIFNSRSGLKTKSLTAGSVEAGCKEDAVFPSPRISVKSTENISQQNQGFNSKIDVDFFLDEDVTVLSVHTFQ